MSEENFGIKVQCPDCGMIFQMNEYGEYFCSQCDRVYPESEIRNVVNPQNFFFA